MQHSFDPHLISIIAIFITLPAMLGGTTVRYPGIGRKSDRVAAFLASGTPRYGRQRIIHGGWARSDAVYGAGRGRADWLNGLVPVMRAAARVLFTNSVFTGVG